MDWFGPCLDELTKISIKLTPGEKRQQAVQFAGLGLATVPAMSAVTNKIQTGKWLPSSAKSPKRWLAGALAQGLFWGGALPAAHHLLARRNLSRAAEDRSAAKELKSLAPEGVSQALKTLPAAQPTLPQSPNLPGVPNG